MTCGASRARSARRRRRPWPRPRSASPRPRRRPQQYGIEVGQEAEKHKKLAKAVGRMQTEMVRRQRMEDAKGGLTAARGRLVGVAGAGYVFARMAGQAMAREEQAQYLRTVINAPDKDAAVGRALEHAREFSRRTMASDAEVLDIQYALNSAGLAEDVARAGTEVVHRLATVTRGSAVQVGNAWTALRTSSPRRSSSTRSAISGSSARA